MYKDDIYIKDIEKKKQLIKKYYEDMVFFDANQILEALQKFKVKEGYAISEYMTCFFAEEFETWEEEYFGEDGVAFYFNYPAVEKDVALIVDYDTFYQLLEDACNTYLTIKPFNKDEIQELLKQIKETLANK